MSEAVALDVTGRWWSRDVNRLRRFVPARAIEDVADVASARLVRRKDAAGSFAKPQAATSAHRASPHRIRKAENRTGDRSCLADPRTRGRAALEKTPKRDCAEHGCSGQRVAGRQALKGTKPQERRLVKRRWPSLRDIAFTQRGRRDRADDARFARGRLRAGNVPIGSAGPETTTAKTLRRRHKCEHEAAV
jgi:hypothetical protein